MERRVRLGWLEDEGEAFEGGYFCFLLQASPVSLISRTNPVNNGLRRSSEEATEEEFK